MTNGERKQEDYATIRRANAIRLGLNSAVHGVTNITIFCANEMWVNDHHLWENIRDDATKILNELMMLRIKIDAMIGPSNHKDDEKEDRNGPY